MRCNDCKNIVGTITVSVIDLSPDEEEMYEFPICRSCLTKKGLYCLVHEQPQLLVHDPDEEDSSEEVPVMGACLACCYEKALTIDSTEKDLFEALLVQYQSQDFVIGLGSMGEIFIEEDLPDDRKLTFGLVLAAALFKQTLPKTVTDLVVNASHAVRN